MKHILAAATVALSLAAISCNDAEKAQIEKFRGTEAYALMQAVEQQDTARIQAIAQHRLYVINIRNLKDGETAISVAVQLEKYDAFKALLNSGADPNLSGFTKGTSAADYAGKLAQQGDRRFSNAINKMNQKH